MTNNYQTGAQPGEIKDKLKQELGNKAREASRQFAERGKEEAEALTDKAADALDDMEAAAEAEADELERRGWDNLSEYVRDMADGISGLSDNLRHKSVDELVRSASDLARSNSGLFLLGSVAIGFGLSRFAKASPTHESPGAYRQPLDEEDGAWRSGTPRMRDDDYAYPRGENASTFDAGDPATSGDYRPYESH